MSAVTGSSLFDLIGAWGQPLHGAMDYTGQIVTSSGATISGMMPSELDDYPTGMDVTRQLVLVKFAGIPASIPSAEDIAAGYDFRDYAILAGATRQYSPVFPYNSTDTVHRNDYRFGEGAWLWRTTSGRVWSVRGIIDGQDIVIKARRVELVDDTWVECARVTLGDFTLGIAWSHPDGRQAMIKVSIQGTSLPTFIEVNCSLGSETTAPVVSATLVTKADRAVSDDGIVKTAEHFIGYRYKPDGALIEYWAGSKLTTSGPQNGSQDVWVWAGDTKTLIASSVVYGGGFQFVDWNGATRFSDTQPRIYCLIGVRYAVSYHLGWKISGVDRYSVAIVGLLGQRSEEIDMAGQENNFGDLVYLLEHPVTGDLINAWWLW